MLLIKEYVKPKDIHEAYEILSNNEKVEIVGGGAFLRLFSKNIDIALDLSDAGLNYIFEDDEKVEVGAMTTFGDIERSAIFKNLFNGAVVKSMSYIVGVQLRNVVTVGGTVYPKYGFSDFITCLLSLNTHVKLYKKGQMSLNEFIHIHTHDSEDILEKIIIYKDIEKASYQTLRNTFSDFGIINVGVSKKDSGFNISVGARPAVAKLADKAMTFISSSELTEENINKCAELASEELIFGSDMRGSADYRKEMCKVLIKRGLTEVIK